MRHKSSFTFIQEMERFKFRQEGRRMYRKAARANARSTHCGLIQQNGGFIYLEAESAAAAYWLNHQAGFNQ